MSDFTFSCSNCHQPIQASSEHSGMEVDCPLCHAKIVIPPPPGAPETPPPKGKLSMAPSTVEHKPQGFAPPPPPRKKKKKFSPGLIAGLLGGAAIIAAGIYFGPKLYDKYKHHEEEKAAAEVAATTPPPPPPEPSATEIMREVAGKFKDMSAFSTQGKTTANLDMSELVPNNPALKSINLTADTAIRLGRPDLYRLEWALQVGQSTVKGATWSAGKGNFVATGPYPAKTRNRETAMAEASGSSGTLGMLLVEMFFDDKDNVATATNQFNKTNSETLNGQDCYVVTGDENGMKLELWVNKKNFLVAQAELFLNGKLDEPAYKAETNSAVKAELMRASKILGTITETYNDTSVNKEMAAADFEKPASAPVAAGPAPMPAPAITRPRR